MSNTANNGTAKMDPNGFSRTHDAQMVYPVGYELPSWASGWTQCDNRGGGYATWLDAADIERSKADLARITAEASRLRTRAQCEAAMRELAVDALDTCKSMRNMYVIVSMRDLWPLRQAR